MRHYFAADVADRLDAALKPGALWTTDADGTLWRNDIGEAFLQQLIADGALVSPEATGDVWAEYERRVEESRLRGYGWAVQVMAGIAESEIRRRADAFAHDFVMHNLLPEMRALLFLATERDCETWIVSASNHWIVESAAAMLGMRRDHVIGIRVAVRDGLLTPDLIDPVSWGPGKVRAVNATIGRSPAIATGDSSGDKELLESAATAVLFTHPGKTDPALIAHARQSGWLLHEASQGLGVQ